MVRSENPFDTKNMVKKPARKIGHFEAQLKTEGTRKSRSRMLKSKLDLLYFKK
jgi:hypothetical protein